MLRIILFYIGLVFLSITISWAHRTGTEIDVYKQINTTNGLSHFGVTSMVKDHEGFLWIGTFKGLNRYDGYELKSFYHATDSGLVSNRIQALYQDQNQHILIGTENGLSMYDYETEVFKTLYPTNSSFNTLIKRNLNTNGMPYINEIKENQEFIICSTQEDGILIFNKTNYELEKVFYPTLINTHQFKSLHIDLLHENYLLIASNLGLFVLDLQTGVFERMLTEHLTYCQDVVSDGYQKIYALDFESLKIIDFKIENEKPILSFNQEVLKGKEYASVQMGDDGALWLMKNNNQMTLLPAPIPTKDIDAQCIDFTFSEDFTRLSSLLLTEDGGWIGSYNQGFFKFRSHPKAFQYSNIKTKEKNTNESSQVISLLHLEKDKVLITFNANHTKIFELQQQGVKQIAQPESEQPIISRVVKDAYGNIWGGSKRVGIFRKKSLEAKWEPIDTRILPQLVDEGIQCLAQDKHGAIWMAGLQGLYRFRLNDQGEIIHCDQLNRLGHVNYNTNLVIQVLYPDPIQNCIWIGTQNHGLLCLDYAPKQPLKAVYCQQYQTQIGDDHSLPSQNITCIQRTPEGRLWIGSLDGGMSYAEEQVNKVSFHTYTEKDGLDDNDVMTFEYDEKGCLWIATNKGINQFDPKTEKFQNYTTEDGLVSASYEVTSTKLENGLMIFGGNNGICYFQPHLVSSNTQIPPLLLGDFKIHNQVIKPGETLYGEQILEKSLEQTQKIDLAYNQNSISVEAISLHFSNPDIYQLRYRLLPEETHWIQTSSKNKTLNYSLLPTGIYTLEIANSNSKNEWSPNRRLIIEVHPPIWETAWAKTIYVLVSILLIYLIMRVILHTNTLEHKLELEHLEKTRLADLDTARLKLFMNISHEFRTPLTLITAPLTVLKNMFENNTDAFQHIDLIQRQAKKMFQLVEQVHDVRKADENILKLNIQTFDFTHLMSEIKRDFEKLADDSQKTLLLKGTAKQLFVVADEQKLEVVLNNLLNNAFKFTQAGDRITLCYEARENGLYFSVEDTGIGIKTDDIPHLFKRFYQASDGKSYIGSGIGLELTKMLVEIHYGNIQVQSTYGEGAKFEVFLPIKVSETDTFSKQRFEEMLAQESHEEKQRLPVKEMIDLSNLIQDESHKNLSVYYVEDNVELRNFVTDVLKQYFKITAFSHGKECLQALDQEWPDLILSDILMPELNGLELCKMIKSDIRTSHIPVVLLTSRSSTDERVEGLEVGADAYITKPFELKHLIASLQNILNNRQKLRERFQIAYPVPLEKKQQNESDQVFLERLYKLLEENLTNESIDLEEFAKELFMSRSQFFRKVKSITNSTPQEIIRVYKLKKSAEFLKEGKYSVADVVVKTGFKSRTHFTKLFKDHFGVTPSKYTSS